MNVNDLEPVVAECGECGARCQLLPYGENEELVCFNCGMQYHKPLVEAFVREGFRQTLKLDYPCMSLVEVERQVEIRSKAAIRTLETIYNSKGANA